ncbi:diguanylate cyclase domain-containing protein [Roseateles sp.]|uniref:bifunctional diguanylate cyclase/phosphodiesterase n=1 Tax=Roseateles sp. TaxID=1971397 RepID=UPI0039E831E1
MNSAVALLLVALVWHVLERSHRDFQEQAKSVADGLAAVAQLNIQSEVDRVDGVIRATASELERLLSGPGGATDATLNDVLRDRYGLLSDAEAFRLTDAAGLVRWGTSLPEGAPKNVSDREYFGEASQLAVPKTFIGGPLTSRVSGNWVVAFMHPVRVRGQFAGVLYVTVNADHFRRMFEQYDLDPLDAVTLRRDDRRLVARFSPGSSAQGQPGDTTVSPELLKAFSAHPRTGTFVSQVLVDGEVRTTAYRALKSWPFVVFAGINNKRFFAPWRQQVWIVASLSALTWFLVALASLLLLRANRREEAAMQALANQGLRVQALLRTAGDGIHIVDGSGRLVEMSDSFAEMLKSTRERLTGRHVASWDVNQDKVAIDAWLAKIKPGDSQRVDVQHRRDDGQVIDVEMQLRVADIGGQILVFSSARDVTAQRKLMREQAAMLDTDLVGMAKVENRTITWRNRAAERILGYGPGELEGQPVRVVYWEEADYQRVGGEGYEAMRREGHYRAHIRMRTKCGDALWIDFGAVPLSESEIFVMLVDITKIKDAHETLVHAASHDSLTQLPNRMLLHDRIAQALAVARRQQKLVAICYLDLDGFKAVNDEHGHDAGDQLLRAVASRLQAAIRPSDTAARLGGDEFVLVLEGVSGDEWRAVAERVAQSIREPILLDSGITVSVGVTIGVAIADPADGASSQSLIDRADHAMLRVKRSGKGTVAV